MGACRSGANTARRPAAAADLGAPQARAAEIPESSTLSTHRTLSAAYEALDTIVERLGRFGLVDAITVLVVDSEWQLAVNMGATEGTHAMSEPDRLSPREAAALLLFRLEAGATFALDEGGFFHCDLNACRAIRTEQRAAECSQIVLSLRAEIRQLLAERAPAVPST